VRIGSRLLGHGRQSLSSWLLRQSVCRHASCSNAALAATCRRLVAMIIYNWICLLYLQYKTITGLNYNSVNHNINHSLALWGTVPVLHKPSKLLTAVNPTQVIGGKASQSTKGIPGVNTWGKHRVNRQYNERLDVRHTANRIHGHNIHAVEQSDGQWLHFCCPTLYRPMPEFRWCFVSASEVTIADQIYAVSVV